MYKIQKLSDEEATLVEPTSCAIHGMDQLNTQAGAEVLVIGAGPTGLVLAQLLKVNGATKVVIAANKGIKTQKAKELDAGDEYIELDRENSKPQWEQIKKDYPYGFDVVVCPYQTFLLARVLVIHLSGRGHRFRKYCRQLHQLCEEGWNTVDIWSLRRRCLGALVS